MLGYLDALIAALSVRDGAEADRLLAHPLARLLPAEVRDEAEAFTRGGCDALAAPLRAMQLRHQTAELLRDGLVADAPEAEAGLADAPAAPDTLRSTGVPPSLRSRRGARPQQMELPLSA